MRANEQKMSTQSTVGAPTQLLDSRPVDNAYQDSGSSPPMASLRLESANSALTKSDTLFRNPAEPMSPETVATMARKRYQKPAPIRAFYGTGENREEYWFVRYREDVLEGGTIKRRARKRRLGRVSEMTKRLAERERDRVLQDINGLNYQPAVRMTFAELAQRYLDSVIPTREPATAKMHTWHLKKFLIPFFGGYQLEAVGQEAAQRLVAQLAKSGGKNGKPMRHPSIRSVIGTLTGIFKVGREWGYTCPEIRISRLKIPDYVPLPKEGKVYKPAEARDIFSRLDRQTAFVVKLQSALLLRPCEVLGLSIHDFDFENKVVTIQRKAYRKELRVIKTKKPKRVPLAPATEKLVREWLEDGYIPNPNGLLFCRKKNGLPLVQKTLRRKLRKVQAALKFQRRGLHGFRHLGASIAAKRTGNIHTAGLLLGHGDASRVTLDYLHPLGDDEIKGAEAVAAELFGDERKKKKQGRAESAPLDGHLMTQNLCPNVSREIASY
jgi:integrase